MPIQENVMTRVTSVTHKKKLAWFMVCSENIIFAAANVALSLNRHMPDKEFDIVIYYTSLSRQNRNAILNIKNVIVRGISLP